MLPAVLSRNAVSCATCVQDRFFGRRRGFLAPTLGLIAIGDSHRAGTTPPNISDSQEPGKWQSEEARGTGFRNNISRQVNIIEIALELGCDQLIGDRITGI